jgi:hypothetical protein
MQCYIFIVPIVHRRRISLVYKSGDAGVGVVEEENWERERIACRFTYYTFVLNLKPNRAYQLGPRWQIAGTLPSREGPQTLVLDQQGRHGIGDCARKSPNSEWRDWECRLESAQKRRGGDTPDGWAGGRLEYSVSERSRSFNFSNRHVYISIYRISRIRGPP